MKDIFSKKFLMMALMLIGIFAIGISIQNLMNPQKLPKVTKSQIAQLESSTFPTEEAAQKAVGKQLFEGVKESGISLSSKANEPGTGIYAYYDGKTKDYVTTYYILKNKDGYQVKIGKVNVTYQKGDKKMWTDKIDGHVYNCYINDYRRFREVDEKEERASTVTLHNDGAIHVVQEK